MEIDDGAEKLNAVMGKYFWVWDWSLINEADKVKYRKAAKELKEHFETNSSKQTHKETFNHTYE